MRIIAGRWKGLRLAAVGKGDQAAHLRPTTDRVRETLFNILSHRVDFEGRRVLDLFAGTGALGLEALSRGAASCSFVDNGRAARSLIQRNIALTGGEDVQVIAKDAQHLGVGTPHDLIFLDPPYGKSMGERALHAAQKGGWIASGAVIVWEEATAPTPIDGLQVILQRSYGKTTLTLLEAPP